MADHIRYEVEGGIGTLTIDRPEKRNAMTYAMLADFHNAIECAGRDDATRVVILTGAGGAFCAGTDLSEDLLMQTAREEAERFLSISPLSARLMKDLVYRGLERDVQTHMRAHAEALAACFASDDHREGVAAFLERRSARFTGR